MSQKKNKNEMNDSSITLIDLSTLKQNNSCTYNKSLLYGRYALNLTFAKIILKEKKQEKQFRVKLEHVGLKNTGLCGISQNQVKIAKNKEIRASRTELKSETVKSLKDIADGIFLCLPSESGFYDLTVSEIDSKPEVFYKFKLVPSKKPKKSGVSGIQKPSHPKHVVVRPIPIKATK
jgi:hypothetical protein